MIPWCFFCLATRDFMNEIASLTRCNNGIFSIDSAFASMATCMSLAKFLMGVRISFTPDVFRA